ncbi:MAG TPA: transcriptional repressor LexA [Candidatus Dormibacteraeota bacterium]|nr:transcriptional repressor LexA [Candidatus Dormibacteraeota bacterium]HVC22892.1 transcriptional repressor LexA [Candidatus Dormibacteraeota bacterium]
MSEGLHPRQQEIVEYLRSRSLDGGYPPSVREIGRAVGLSSSSTVQNHLNVLERKGMIRRDPTKSRTVLLTDSSVPATHGAGAYWLPLVGQVAAGAPLLAEQNIEEHLAIGPEIAGGDDSFLLRVRGESMQDDGIFDGDLVVVKPTSDVTNGTVTVVRLENPETGESEVTVKRLYREAGHLRLQPSNDAFAPLIVDDASVEGKVVAVIRVLRQ